LFDVHVGVGVAVLGLNLVAGAWGGVSWLAERPSVTFWYLLRAAQAAVVAEALVGVILLVSGREPDDALHYVYGIGPLVVAVVAETIRATAAVRELGDVEFKSLGTERQRAVAVAIVRREMGVMSVAALTIFGLALRAALT
jgi:hypothetical protein